jgi:O-antigen ligase
LIFAPLAYGAVHPWAYYAVGLVAAFISLALLAWLFIKILLRPDESRSLPFPPLWWLTAGLVILLIIQVMPWPAGLVTHLSPQAREIRALGNGFGLGNALPFSLNPSASLLEGLKLWPALTLFFILIYAINNDRQIQGLIWLMLGVALFEVFYGFGHFRHPTIWGWYNCYAGSRLCGTFINCDNLATLLAMAILLGFGLFLGLRETPSVLPGELTDWARIRLWSRSEHTEPQIRRFFLLLVLLILGVGLIFTGSRGGMVSLLVGFALMGLLIWSQRWKTGYIIISLILVAAIFCYSLFLGSSQALGRFYSLDYQVRFQAYKGALAVFKEFPLTGSGIGTFGELFYRFEPASLKGWYFLQAHSDWLQLLAETGLVGFALVSAAGVMFFSVLVRQWRRRRQGFARGITLGGLAALAAGSFHALVDFPFHIPAISLMFAGIAALTYSAAHYHRRQTAGFSYPTIILPGSRRVIPLFLILLLMGLQLAFGARVCYNWLAENAAPTEINSTRTPPRLEVEDFSRALLYNRANSKYYLGLAETLTTRSGGAHLPEVERYLKAAIFYAPANWGYRMKLGEFYLKHYQDSPNRFIPAALRELAAAVTLFPESAMLKQRLASTLAWAEKYYFGLIPAPWRLKASHFP